MTQADCTKVQARENRTVYRAMHILERRLRAVGPVMNDPALVRNWLQIKLADKAHEVFCALFLDTQHQFIACEELAQGTLNEAAVYPREVVRAALRHNAAAVMFAHNHPSGNTAPSDADVRLTRRLKDALEAVDIRVLDHFIVGGKGVPLSFAERGLL